MLNSKSYQIEQVIVGQYDITEGVSAFAYYESILSPAISIELVVIDSEGLLSGGRRGGNGILGGELSSIKINTPNGGLEFETLYLRQISNSTPSSTNNIFVLTLTTPEALINETSRCCKRYDGKISDIVSKIANETFLLDSERIINVEDTANTYSFIGNARKPFHTITWLAKKSIPKGGRSARDDEGSAGFFFYEDRFGYKFISVDTLCNKTSDDPILEYYQSEATDPNQDDKFSILNYTYETNYDLLENLRLGMFSNVNYFWNAYSLTTKCYQYDLNNSYSKKIKTLEDSSSLFNIPLGLENSPSRIMVGVLDGGTLQRDGKVPDNTFSQDQAKYQAQAVVRYNLIFSQSVSITISSNVTLKVGDVINCKFLLPNSGEDLIRSGNYLIAELSHQFTDGNGYSGLRLIRDSYSGD